ncbi:MAG: helix-turn-helix domain-containing protein [Planctomycetaceae bacterium]|nr:helix-turn-helix domain-containing protein [Planctomycetaceae bacterium]
MRAQTVLLAVDGCDNETIAAQLEISEPTVGKWRNWFVTSRCAGTGYPTRRSQTVSAFEVGS